MMDTERKVYTTPELVEHGILREVTNTEGAFGPDDGEWPHSRVNA